MTKLPHALSVIDAAHAQDPNTITINAQTIPYELHYAQKCTAYLLQHVGSSHTPGEAAPRPNASDILQLAVRAQHFRRWELPRSSYPMTKGGYHAWRTAAKKRQAELVCGILTDVGYTAEEAGRVAGLIRKDGLGVKRKEGEEGGEEREVQILEDVACLVFLDDQFEEFERGWDEEKVIGVLRKTWGKMSPRGRELALGLRMEGRCKEVMDKALAG